MNKNVNRTAIYDYSLLEMYHFDICYIEKVLLLLAKNIHRIILFSSNIKYNL